ncbi:MAG: hypothetical protein ABSF23_02415 [Terracidiphilus sp.]|jgi:probable HAF family extracellular repeat protein
MKSLFSACLLVCVSLTLGAQGANGKHDSANRVLPAGNSFQGLGDLPGAALASRALAVSADGSVVVGSATTADGEEAFRWTPEEGMVSLGKISGAGNTQSWAAAVSADGSTIVGYVEAGGSGWDHHKGFRWTRSKGMAPLSALEGSARSEILGVSAGGGVLIGDDGQQAFRWTQGGGSVRLGLLPGRANSRAIAVSADGSVVVGSSYDLPSWGHEEAFVWTQQGGVQGLGIMPGGTWSFPNAISPDGEVVAGTASTDSGPVAFRWTRAAGMVSLGRLPGTSITHPGSVNANGTIVVGGGYADRDHATAFIWDAAHGMRSLQNALQSDYGLNLAGWHLQHASGITPDGKVIVGWGIDPAGSQEAFRVVLADKVPAAVSGK